MASAYADYARTAQAAGTPAIFLGTEKVVLENLLYVALQVPQGVPAVPAAQWAAGLTAFWLAPPIIFGYGPTSGIPGAPALIPALTAIYSNPLNTDQTAALLVATALHAATISVLVTGVGTVPIV